jgi:hypothetical protein
MQTKEETTRPPHLVTNAQHIFSEENVTDQSLNDALVQLDAQKIITDSIPQKEGATRMPL